MDGWIDRCKGYNVLCVCICAQLCPTLCDSPDCSPPGSSVLGISQARILEWVAVSFSRGLSRPRDQTHVACIVGGFFTVWATREAILHIYEWLTIYIITCIWLITYNYISYVFMIQFSSVAQSCPTLCDPMNRSMPGLPIHHHLPEFTQTHVHRVGDAIHPSHPLLSPFPPAPNPSQHQGLFQWVNTSHELAKILEFQL